MIFSGVSPDGKFVEIIELPHEKHPYFVACQFHPEYSPNHSPLIRFSSLSSPPLGKIASEAKTLSMT